jgi:hypothetical protein
MADADTPPDDARDLELATHLNNLLRTYAEGDRRDGGGDALGMLLRLHEDLCRALCALAAEAAGAAGGRDGAAGPRDWLARSRVADKLLFLVEAVFLVILNQADEVAERSYGFVEGSLGENLAGTVRDLLRRHADYGAFAADAVLGVEAAVGLDLFVAELRRLPPRPEELERALAESQRLSDRLRGEVERLGAELARARARARGRAGGAAGDGAVLRRVRAAVARRFHPDAVRGGDPLARLVRQEVFKEMQQVLEEVERGED